MAHTDTPNLSARPRSIGPRSIGAHAAAVLAVAVLCATTLVAGAAGAATAPTTATEISTAKDGSVGTILVADNTVYTLKLKSKTCSAACLKVWKPVLLPTGVKTPTAGDGVSAAKLGTTATADGSLQITYAGDPLYWSTKDKAPGDVKGAVKDKFGTGAVVVTAKASTTKTDPGTGGTAF